MKTETNINSKAGYDYITLSSGQSENVISALLGYSLAKAARPDVIEIQVSTTPGAKRHDVLPAFDRLDIFKKQNKK